jgi:Tol biopolymer transport system component
LDSPLLRGALVTSALVLAALAVAAPAQATFPGKNGKIAFARINEHENGEIWTIGPDGSALEKLTDARGFENDFGGDGGPQWSPDGKRILFGRSSGDPRKDGLLIMDADGGNQTKIAEALVGARWSPDGRKLAGSECTDSCDIYLINPDGTGRTLVARNGIWPSWSRDGKRLVFEMCCSRDLNKALFVIDADGTDRQMLTEGEHPAWGPGEVIAFDRRDGPPHFDHEVFTIKADGSGETRITDNLEFDLRLGWSPGGERLLYGSIGNIFGTGRRLTTVDADGSDRFLVSTDTLSADWSPDASKVAFGEGPLRVVGIDGTGLTKLTTPDVTSESHDVSPDWQPIPPPARADYRNEAQLCKAEREYWGDTEFRRRYGGRANAHGKCVGANTP